MRTIAEVLELVKGGGDATEEELRYTLIALEALSTMDGSALRRASRMEWGERFTRWKRALNQQPKKYVGWNNDPDNPDYQRRRKESLALLKRITE